jgi:amino acid transporter
MEAGKTYSASTSTVTPLITRPAGARTLPKAFDGFLRNSANSPDTPIRGREFDANQAAYNTANTALVKKLKGRHLQMIAIGGSIGEPG